jgi:hypothetical protein
MTQPFSYKKSFARAAASMVLGRHRASDILKANWKDDSAAALIIKSATSPTDTTSFPPQSGLKVLTQLAPQAASSRVLALATSVDLTGFNIIHVPHIGASGRPAAAWIAEGQPAPALALVLISATVGPVRRLLILSALTSEMQSASGDTAAALIDQALSASIEEAMDKALFSDTAETDSQPAGLLHGVIPITAATGGGTSAMVGDIAALAAAIAAAGVNADTMVIVTTAKLATKLRLMASPKFTNEVYSSAQLADGTIIALIPAGVVTGYTGTVHLETSREVAIHYEDTNPQPLLASPTRSAFQEDVNALKLRAWAAWTALPGCVQVINRATW